MHTLSRILALVGLSIALGGCASPRIDTTRLTSTDIVKMTDEMTASLAGDEVIGERTENSDEWVVSIDRVRNLSEHPIPMRERWATMARPARVACRPIRSTPPSIPTPSVRSTCAAIPTSAPSR